MGDTDFTVKVLDVQRMRYRDAYDQPLAWMAPGTVYKVTMQPLNTSNYFAPGHRLRIEVSGSNVPRFDRNLNNAVHHSAQDPSQVTVTIVKG